MKICICVENGAVCEAYVEKDRSDPEPRLVVLDVDSDCEDMSAVRAEWSRIASSQDYAPAEIG